MRSSLLAWIILGLFVATPSAAQAQIITQWNFNSGAPNATSPAPSIGSGKASLAGGTVAVFASGSGSSDPAPVSNLAWNTSNYPAQGTKSGQAGVRFDVSTVGFFGPLFVSFDQFNSNTASRFSKLEYTTDGTTFIEHTSPIVTSVANTWFNKRTFDFSGISAAFDNPNFGFRIVTIFEPTTSSYAATNATSTYSTAGQIRFDMVTVAVPEPGTLALVGMVALGAAAGAGGKAWRRRLRTQPA